MCYATFMKQVNKEVEKRTGLSLDLLPDWLSRDTYNDRVSIKEAVEICLDQIGYYDFEEKLVDEN